MREQNFRNLFHHNLKECETNLRMRTTLFQKQHHKTCERVRDTNLSAFCVFRTSKLLLRALSTDSDHGTEELLCGVTLKTLQELRTLTFVGRTIGVTSLHTNVHPSVQDVRDLLVHHLFLR